MGSRFPPQRNDPGGVIKQDVEEAKEVFLAKRLLAG